MTSFSPLVYSIKKLEKVGLEKKLVRRHCCVVETCECRKLLTVESERVINYFLQFHNDAKYASPVCSDVKFAKDGYIKHDIGFRNHGKRKTAGKAAKTSKQLT